VRVRRILARHFFPPGAGKPRALLAWACWEACARGPQPQQSQRMWCSEDGCYREGEPYHPREHGPRLLLPCWLLLAVHTVQR
jgi:hypothetical protein